MSGLVVPSLCGWQCALALAESRLAVPDARLDIRTSFDDPDDERKPPRRWTLSAAAAGLGVQVHRAGRNLLKLRFRLAGSLSLGEQVQHFDKATLEIDAAIEVKQLGGRQEVFAALNRQRPRVRVLATGCDPVALEFAVLQWLEAQGPEARISLFSFNTAGVKFGSTLFNQFMVTTAYAEASSVQASLVLLMGDSATAAAAAPPPIDPHVLPQGENAVLWVDSATLQRTHDLAPLLNAMIDLMFHPRPLNVEIPRVSAAMRRWAGTIIDHVSLHEPLNFISMQMTDGALLLSATPISIEELDAMTAGDLTISNGSLVQEKACDLMSDCVLSYLDERTLKRVLHQKRPALLSEVATIAARHSNWLRSFGPLYLAHTLRQSERGDRLPFFRLDKAKLKTRFKSAVNSEECKKLLEELYPLAFCLVRPRLALYREDSARWLPAYRDHLASAAYVEHLLKLPNGAMQAHDDFAKLDLLDPSGTVAPALYPQTLGRLMERNAELHWQSVIAERPADFRLGLEHVLGGIAAGSVKLPVPAAWIAQAGGAHGVADAWMRERQADKPGDGLGLAEAIRRFLQGKPWAGENATKSLSYAVGGAVLVALVVPTYALAANLDIQDAAALAGFVEQLADWFVQSAPVGLAQAVGAGLGVTSFIMFGAKGLRYLAQEITRGAQTAARFFESAAGLAFRTAGCVLSLASLVLSLVDLAKDIEHGCVRDIVLDSIGALAALVSIVGFVFFPASPLGAAMLLVGIALALVRFFWEPVEKSLDDLAEADFVNGLPAELRA